MSKTVIPARYIMVIGTFILAVILYIDRVCISVAKDDIGSTLQLSDKQMGWVLSIFALGYALFQAPSGIIADRLGPRKLLSGIVFIWSAFTALTGAVFNFISLLMIRFLFGAGEAGAFPGMSKAVYNWLPLKERGTVTGINFSGSRLGAAFALPGVAWLIETVGWRLAFVWLGGLGILWGLAWVIFFRDDPLEHDGVSDEEKIYIQETRQQKELGKVEAIPFSQIIQNKNVVLLMIQYFCSNFIFFFSLTWLFPYLKNTYDLGSVAGGWLASIPLICGAIGNWVSGFWVDGLYRKGNWKASRQVPAMIGFTFAAIGFLGSAYAGNVYIAVIFLSMAIFGADMTLAPSWAACVDIGKTNAGVVSGTMNMAGNIGSFITSLAFPYLIAWFGGTNPFFYTGAVLSILAIWQWRSIKVDVPIAIGKT